jgi:thioredoxin reductase
MKQDRKDEMRREDVVIVGAGPAGIAAAIQLRRAGLDPLVFEKKSVGGLLVNAHLVENYPGFPDGISGPALVGLMRAQLERHAARILPHEVSHVDYRDGRFILKAGHSEVCAKLVIIASGTRPRQITSLGVAEDAQERILYEVHPIRGARDKSIAIVGGGDAAFDYALSLESKNKVIILSRRAKPRCLDLLRERAESAAAISLLSNTEAKQVEMAEDGRLLIECRGQAVNGRITADYLILAIGREPELGFLSGRLAELVESKRSEGVLHLIGDVRTGSMRQTAIATGDGIMAAMRAAAKLKEGLT